MANLNLNDEEVAFLVEALESALSDLRMEIADTDSMMFKRRLRDRKEVLVGLLTKLKEVPQLIGA
jgi:hypothetical protein